MSTQQAQKPAQPRFKVVGHRGARGLAPENTLAAIRKGLEHHVDEIEIDVRVTKDNVVILHHDRDLIDQAHNSLDVHTHTYAELKQHKPDLTTLAEAIKAINRMVPLQIEVKQAELVQPIVEVVRGYLNEGWQPTDFLFGSKSQKTLRELNRDIPAIPTVVIEAYSGIIASWRARQLGTRRISMNKRGFWSGFVRMISRNNQLYAYTLDDTHQAQQWVKLGMSGVITDRPDLYDSHNASHNKRSS